MVVTYKPDRPASSTVATEVFFYEPDVLLEVLEERGWLHALSRVATRTRHH